jgi:hypothetical protein
MPGQNHFRVPARDDLGCTGPLQKVPYPIGHILMYREGALPIILGPLKCAAVDLALGSKDI